MQKYLSRLGLSLAAFIVSASIAIVGVGFLLAALFLAVQDISSPTIAALSTGAAALVIAGVIALAARARMHRGIAAARQDDKAAQPDLAVEIGQVVGSQMADWIRGHPKSATGLALLAGFVVGASPELRGALRDLVKRPE